MPLQATSGAASYDAFGGGVAAVPNYIEDVFSTYLYTANGGANAITNGIDLSTKGGLVWAKARNLGGGTGVYGAGSHSLFDTARGVNSAIASNSTAGADTTSGHMSSFDTTGFTLAGNWEPNEYGYLYASWTFRKQPKFFDIQTWTGSGSNRTISHSLGSVPACIMVKRTDTTGAWQVYHRSLANTEYLVLNTTAAKATGATRWNSTTPTSTVFSLGTDATVNASGGTYVAYIFAHDAGGFGLTGTDNVISCGSFTTDGSGNASISLGYEPQWVLAKMTSTADFWYLMDNMRGMPVGSATAAGLYPNSSGVENQNLQITLTPTGFNCDADFQASTGAQTWIYIAIRRGPMKVPTSGTSVFSPLSYTNSTGGVTISSLTHPADLVITDRKNVSSHRAVWDRLRGATKAIYTNLTNAEGTVGDGLSSFASNVGYTTGSGGAADNTVDGSQINWNFRRAPSFFDEVCYTGTGGGQVVSHNLGVVPELAITKCRSTSSTNWVVCSAYAGTLNLNSTSAQSGTAWSFNGTNPTSTEFTTRGASNSEVNTSGSTFCLYLFATCVGVSKVGSYTGNGTTQTINCGFSGGARFVLIKRTDSTGDWYVYDTARGMTVLTDPYILLNTSAAETATLGSVTTVSTGFALDSTILAAINVNAGTYIFLAIA